MCLSRIERTEAASGLSKSAKFDVGSSNIDKRVTNCRCGLTNIHHTVVTFDWRKRGTIADFVKARGDSCLASSVATQTRCDIWDTSCALLGSIDGVRGPDRNQTLLPYGSDTPKSMHFSSLEY